MASTQASIDFSEDCYKATFLFLSSTDSQSITLSNLPIDKWVHITFILINNNVDLYVNCNLKKRYTLKSVPKYNHGDLYITSYGGFLGYISAH